MTSDQARIVARIEKVQAMLQEEPTDTFLRYSLAMDQEKIGEHEASSRGLRELMSDDPPYVPAFFMLGQHLVAHNQVNDARSVLRDGIEQARTQQNDHAAGEMSEFLASLGELGE